MAAKQRSALGEKNARAKIDGVDVMKIRNIYADGKSSIDMLAEQFSISRANVHAIITGKLWPHLPLVPRSFKRFSAARAAHQLKVRT